MEPIDLTQLDKCDIDEKSSSDHSSTNRTTTSCWSVENILQINKNESNSPTFTHGKCDVSNLSDQEQDRSRQPQPNEISSVLLRGEPIVSLVIDGKERLCLAQISNTLLKNFSYNEIHNRRVALGITCVQCTPVQLEILRRHGAMPISSRRCGMITKREAERLVTSFLEEHSPPRLPETFAFQVYHTCGWGCKGSFIPSRYNSSRAKCIKCTFCNLILSPNKFIFHFHRMPSSKYHHPDAANFNSWRRHLFLDYDTPNEDLSHAWEDVKAMFNGGSRKKPPSDSNCFRSSPNKNEESYTKCEHLRNTTKPGCVGEYSPSENVSNAPMVSPSVSLLYNATVNRNYSFNFFNQPKYFQSGFNFQNFIKHPSAPFRLLTESAPRLNYSLENENSKSNYFIPNSQHQNTVDIMFQKYGNKYHNYFHQRNLSTGSMFSMDPLPFLYPPFPTNEKNKFHLNNLVNIHNLTDKPINRPDESSRHNQILSDDLSSDHEQN